MRLLAVALLVATGLAAGCGGEEEPARWPGTAATLGPLPVDRFNARAEDVDEPWERSPLLTAAEFSRADLADSRTVSAVARREGEQGPTALAEVVFDGLLDDSIRARRIVLELERREDGTWLAVSAVATQRCQPERGHEDFSVDPCL